MSSDPQATQVNLLRHQRTEIPPNKAQRKHFKKIKFRHKKMYPWNTFLCGQQWRQYLDLMCNQSCIWLNQATWEIGPSTPENNRNVISSSADKIKRKDESWLNVHMLVKNSKLKTSNEEAPIVCSSDEWICSQSSQQRICSQTDQQYQ